MDHNKDSLISAHMQVQIAATKGRGGGVVVVHEEKKADGSYQGHLEKCPCAGTNSSKYGKHSKPGRLLLR